MERNNKKWAEVLEAHKEELPEKLYEILLKMEQMPPVVRAIALGSVVKSSHSIPLCMIGIELIDSLMLEEDPAIGGGCMIIRVVRISGPEVQNISEAESISIN